MKNKDLFTFKEGLTQAKVLPGVKFAYAVAKNSKLVGGEIETLQETIKPTEEYSDFEKERDEIVKKYAVKDKNGGAKQESKEVNGQHFTFYNIEKDKIDISNKELKELNEKFKEAVDARDIQLKEYAELMEVECNIEVHKIVLDLIPEDITGGTIELIDWMIEE